MPNELDGHAALLIDRLFKWKDHQHDVGDFADRLEPTRALRPDLRADVIHDRNAEALDAAREPQVEIWKVDDDKRIGTIAASGGDQPAQCRVRPGNLPYRLG